MKNCSGAMVVFGLLLMQASTALAQAAAVTPPAAVSPDRLFASAPTLDVKDGETVRPGSWRLNPTVNPDTYTVQLGVAERREVCFTSGARSLCRTVGVGDRYDFVVEHAGVLHPTRIEGAFVAPAAVFDRAYQAAHQGKVRVEVPEVYELVNVAIALTPTARKQKGLVITDTAYHADLLTWFAPVAKHPLIAALDSEMVKSSGRYFELKMNGYAFTYGRDGKIVRSPIYDRTGFSGSPANNLLPMLELLRSFSDQSRFREFYAGHRDLYRSQIRYFEEDADVAGMLRWLEGRFPDADAYDTTKIIFSPLVGHNQSLTHFESNGFTELQPHVNFPYPTPDPALSPGGAAFRRGQILFTELNHGFLSPTDNRYGAEIEAALSRRDVWVRKGSTGDAYPSTRAVFAEMMNWGLVSLYALDVAPKSDRDLLIARLEPYMNRRDSSGFRSSTDSWWRSIRIAHAGPRWPTSTRASFNGSPTSNSGLYALQRASRRPHLDGERLVTAFNASAS